MLDIKNIEPTLILVRDDMSYAEFMGYLKTVGTSLFFYKFTQLDVYNFLNSKGFKDVSSSVKTLYYTVVDSYILVISFEGLNIKEKFWVQLSERNLNYMETYGKTHDDFFASCSNDYQSSYELYNETMDRPYCEYFVIIHDIADQPLRRIDLFFKYENSQYMNISIFRKKGGYIHIFYDNYDIVADYFFSDFIEFFSGTMRVARLLHKKNCKSIDILADSGVIDTTQLTLDNFHLFWQRLTPEQILLLEMTDI